jgi:hypothetical protein
MTINDQDFITAALGVKHYIRKLPPLLGHSAEFFVVIKQFEYSFRQQLRTATGNKFASETALHNLRQPPYISSDCGNAG